MPATGVLAPSIKIGGTELSDELRDSLVELRVDLTASTPAQLLVRFIDWDGSLALGNTFALGQTIDVRLPEARGALQQPQMTGLAPFEITEIGVEAPETGVSELMVVAHDKSHRLGLGTVTRSFENTSPADVARWVVSDAGLSFRSRVSAPAFTTPMPYFMAADSALALLNELSGRFGALWWVTPQGAVEVGDPGSRDQVEVTYGTNLSSCSVRVSGRCPAEVTVGGWDHTRMQRISGNAKTTLAGPTAIRTSTPFPRRELTVTSARAADQAEAKALATMLAQRSAARCLDVRGTAVSQPRLVPGGRVKITGFPSAAGTYEVQRVEHVFRPSGTLETRFTAGERTPTSLGEGGDQSRASSIRFDGMVVGVVTDNNDPNRLGRVKVKFPWLTDEHASGWARVVAFGGGSGTSKSQARGAHFVPEVNDEVLVGFEGGDLRKPVVLGTLYNDTTKAPTWERGSRGEVVTRSITSRLGHVFEMSDGSADPARHVLIKLADGATRLRVGQDQVEVETRSGKPISLKSGQASITITDKGDISIAGNKVTIDAKMDASITAGTKLTAKGTAGATLESSAQAVVKGSVTDVGGSGPTSVKGAIVKIN